MKIKAIFVRKDTIVEGYGVLYRGLYRVEMPDDYDPDTVTAVDLVCDPALLTIPREEDEEVSR